MLIQSRLVGTRSIEINGHAAFSPENVDRIDITQWLQPMNWIELELKDDQRSLAREATFTLLIVESDGEPAG